MFIFGFVWGWVHKILVGSVTSLLIQEIDTIITCSCHSKTVYLRLGIYWLAYVHELLDCNMEHCVHLSAHPRQCIWQWVHCTHVCRFVFSCIVILILSIPLPLPPSLSLTVPLQPISTVKQSPWECGHHSSGSWVRTISQNRCTRFPAWDCVPRVWRCVLYPSTHWLSLFKLFFHIGMVVFLYHVIHPLFLRLASTSSDLHVKYSLSICGGVLPLLSSLNCQISFSWHIALSTLRFV